MNKLLAVLVLAGLAGEPQADAIDDYVTAEIARQNVPGLALAVMRHGQIVRAQGYGFANLEHHVPVHPDTVFKSGALGKQFTAVAVMLLVEDGKLRLDESVRTYLPEAPRSWAPITIRNILNHTSGLPPYPAGEFRTDYSDDELLGIIYEQPLSFAAGSRWGYSYTAYVTLGLLIRKVTGESYVDLLAKRVFTPLGMQTARQIDEIAIVPNRAAGYEHRDGRLRNAEWVSPTANSTADGSLYLSVLDYARWDAGLLGRKLLKPESWAEISRPARIASGRTYPYGFGWFIEHGAGQEIWRHSGNWQGFETFVIHYQRDGLTVVALTNGDSGNPDSIARHVAGLLEPKLVQAPGAPIEDREPQLTARLKNLLHQIADDKAPYSDFAFFAKQDFADLMSMYQATLQPLGALREIALFAREELGDDTVYRYRARYEQGVLDVMVGYAPNGKIATLNITPADGWNAPVPK
jgi:CubicO group peptidase (beta-lactamase class C family)